jgi:hypothetical protein
MPFRLIFVFEAVVAELTRVLPLQFVRSVVFYRSVGILRTKRWRDDTGLTAALLRFQISWAF